MPPPIDRASNSLTILLICAIAAVIAVFGTGHPDRLVAKHAASVKSIPKWMIDQHLPEIGYAELLAIREGRCRNDPPVVHPKADGTVAVSCRTTGGWPQTYLLTGDRQGQDPNAIR